MPDTVIVIGGGIAGCSAAWAMAKRGLNVTLLERNANLAGEASGNPLAMLYPRLSNDAPKSMFALSAFHHSIALYQSLHLNADAFQQCGMLQLGFNAAEQKRIQQAAQQFTSTPGIALLDAAHASAIAGVSLNHSALYFSYAGWVQPQQLCKRLTEHPDIHVHTRMQVNQVNKCDDGFEVHSHEQVFKSDIVVIANAASAMQLVPQMAMRLQSVRGQVSLLTATAQSQKINTVICSDGYISPAAYQGMHCLGASYDNLDTTNHSQNEIIVHAADHQQNLQKLHPISTALHDELNDNLAGGRASVRCTAIDYWPLAGRLIDAEALKQTPPRPSTDVHSLPWIEGLYMNIAHGSKGFTTAPLCAEMIACMACGEPLPLSAEIAGLLNPNRFLLKEMGLKRLAKMVANAHQH